MDVAAPVEAHLAQARVDAWRTDGDTKQLYLALRDLVVSLVAARRVGDAAAVAGEMSRFVEPGWHAAVRLEGAQVPAELWISGSIGDAHDGLQLALELALGMGDAHRVAWLRYRMAQFAVAGATPEEAVTRCQAAIEALEPLNRPVLLGLAWSHLGAAHAYLGDYRAARRSGAQAHQLLQSHPVKATLFHCAALMAARARRAEEARLLGIEGDRQLHRLSHPSLRAIAQRLKQLTAEALGVGCIAAATAVRSRCEGRRAPPPHIDDVDADALLLGVLSGPEDV
jgi:hypothetical protein